MGPKTVYYKMEMVHLGENMSRNSGHKKAPLAGGPDFHVSNFSCISDRVSHNCLQQIISRDLHFKDIADEGSKESEELVIAIRGRKDPGHVWQKASQNSIL